MTWQAFWFLSGPSHAFSTVLRLENRSYLFYQEVFGGSVDSWLRQETQIWLYYRYVLKQKSKNVGYICSAHYCLPLMCILCMKFLNQNSLFSLLHSLLPFTMRILKNHITSLICLMNVIYPFGLTFPNTLHVLTFKWMFH